MLQLEGYDNDEYKTFLKNNKNKVNKLVYKLDKEQKTPLVWTDRAKRLLKKHKIVNIICFVVAIIISFIMLNVTDSHIVSVLVTIVLSQSSTR